MLQGSLFNTTSSAAGYRLEYMELYNWGTFDREVYRISPQGNNTLLTGANASGKSTLIDGLLTLLVPKQTQRSYNQSSGAERKGDRTVDSYFYGYFGNRHVDGQSEATTLKLREKGNTYSVLLATFCCADRRPVTLFQIRYFSGDEVKTLFGIGREKLSISVNFLDFRNDGAWRRSFERAFNTNQKRKVVDFFDGPGAYQAKMIDIFGMRSDKAMSLFNQIVGVKVLDDLNTFISNNMLEEPEVTAEEQYKQLHDTFQNLMEARKKIDMTEEMIHQLTVIDSSATKREETIVEISRLETEKQLAAYWCALTTYQLCTSRAEQLEAKHRLVDNQIADAKDRLDTLKDEISHLTVEIERDAVGSRIKALETEINRLHKSKDLRRQKWNEYNKLAGELQLATSPDAEIFAENRQRARDEKARLSKLIDTELFNLYHDRRSEQDQIESQIKNIKAEAEYLHKKQSNIAGRVAEIRDEILQATGANRHEIPFIGELVKVREDQSDWERPIERLLHNLALRIIVPDQYYDNVNEYVNSHNLRGRIVYHRYSGFSSLNAMMADSPASDTLPGKIEVNNRSPYARWVEEVIVRDYNYRCVESLSEFNRLTDKAITRQGLIKSTADKHEKDDRPETYDRKTFVLGWDNTQKLQQLRNQLKELQEHQRAKAEELKKIEAQRHTASDQRDNLSKILEGYKAFDDIDWHTYALSIEEKTREKEALEATNNRVKELQRQLDAKKSKAIEIETAKDTLIRQSAEVERQIADTDTRKKQAHQTLNDVGAIDISDFENRHTQLQGADLDNIDTLVAELQSRLSEACHQSQLERERAENNLKNNIHTFKYPSEEITRQFRDWRSEVATLPGADHLDLISEYRAMLRRLHEEDLPGFRDKLNVYLRESVTTQINSFSNYFDTWERSIRKNIDMLNDSLQGIDFNTFPAPTYIQLAMRRRLDDDTALFREMLEKALPNIREVDSTIDGRRIHFEHHIKPFMDKMADSTWRDRVMNVRKWYNYKAEELIRQTGQRFKTYESMGHLSGGEKAQLTYTILGSAIAYQFGLTRSGLEPSFRFIAIDEAFKAQDEDKARYLLSLCKQLHLQFLVVTPSDNIHIVENDISVVHFVQRRDNGRSVVIDLPISEYRQRMQQISPK